MKKFLLLILICSVQTIFSQTTQKRNSTDKTKAPTENNMERAEENNHIYNTAGIDNAPEFPGGINAFDSFIKQNFKTPKEGLKGKIHTTFIIEKDGSLSDIKILRDLGHETGAEAERVLKLSPKWNPGKQDNKTIRVLFSMPIIIN